MVGGRWYVVGVGCDVGSDRWEVGGGMWAVECGR